MSITVVTTRDYDNVPTCSEKYELGTQWRVNGGNLEIFAGRTLVALYPSSNWVSVYADDAMQLHKGGTKPDYSSMPTVSASPAENAGFEDPLGPPRGIQPNQPVLDPDEITFDAVAWGRPAVVEDPTYGDDSVASEEQQIIPDVDIAAARAAMVPVAFRPRRYRAAPPPATKAPTGPRMLPVRLRMRPYRGERDVEPATTGDAAEPRMIPVTMRSTIYRAARHVRRETEPGDELGDDQSEA